MNKEKPPKHHRICTNCMVQSTGNTVKECEEAFPRCGLNGGVPNDACKTTISQDGINVFELITVDDLNKLRKTAESKVASVKSTPKTSKSKNSKN